VIGRKRCTSGSLTWAGGQANRINGPQPRGTAARIAPPDRRPGRRKPGLGRKSGE